MKSTIQLAGAVCISLAFSTMIASGAETVGTGPSFKGPIGLQLYSLRAQMIKNVPATLDWVRNTGIKNVELAGTYNFTPEQFKKELDSRGLNPVSGHFPFERYRDDAEGIARDAKALGLKYVGCAWIPHKAPFDEKACREAIAVFNKAGEALAQQGLRLFYHAHGYEFQPHGSGTLLDLMMAEMNPKFANFQMDVFWIVHPGHDPVKLLERYGSRWELMHLKGMKTGTPTGILTGTADVANDTAVGVGQIDFVPILRAAQKVGVKWYFIEDESAVSEKQIQESLRFLERVRW